MIARSSCLVRTESLGSRQLFRIHRAFKAVLGFSTSLCIFRVLRGTILVAAILVVVVMLLMLVHSVSLLISKTRRLCRVVVTKDQR
ncbi:hypothetical protein GGR51DRAFT_536213 [Nemania sp. FL0031]|nr:hypothetical protein GGR51DRAFT_536213 [Nemania sp. FL0031]